MSVVYQTRLADVSREIELLRSQILPLNDRLERLEREQDSLESEAFIAANKIRKADVEMSSGDGKPWFGTVMKFKDWLRGKSSKRWAEWNGRIYHTSDLIAGRMPHMPGYVDQLTD